MCPIAGMGGRNKRNQTLMQFEKERETSWTVDGVSQGEGKKRRSKVDDVGQRVRELKDEALHKFEG